MAGSARQWAGRCLSWEAGMTYCDRMHCHRTLGLARYVVTYWAEGVRVTDVRAFCEAHAEGVTA